MNISEAHILQMTDAEGSLLARQTVTLSREDARVIRAAAKMLRGKRFRMTIRCDACFEANRGDGMRGEITRAHINLECRCRFLRYQGETP